MIENTFRSGNYNQWDHFVTNVLPTKNMILRQEVIPKIDSILISMLGQNSKIEKTSIDVSEVCDKQSLKSIVYTLIYTVFDFKNPEAPTAAVEKDTQIISQSLLRQDFKLNNVSIDINTGKMVIIYEVPLEEK